MSDEATEPESRISRSTRRALLIAGGTAAVGAAAAAAASPAEAANGKAVILGAANTASAQTVIRSTAATGAGIVVQNTGKAHGSYFTSSQGNGFIGGTYSPNSSGATVINYSTTPNGSGSAVTASAGLQTGVLAVTNGGNRYAGLFQNGAATPNFRCLWCETHCAGIWRQGPCHKSVPEVRSWGSHSKGRVVTQLQPSSRVARRRGRGVPPS